MTDLNNFFNLGTNYFSLTSKKCKFTIETLEEPNGTVRNALMVYPILDEIVNYAFSGNQGLCITTPHGSLREKNVLSALLSLPNNKAKNTLLFFEEYGFFLPIPNEGTEIDPTALIEILNRLKATVLLMTALESQNPDYQQILHLSLYLFMGKQVTLSVSDKMSYTTLRHPIHGIFETQSRTNFTYQTDDDYIFVDDLIYSSQYKLSVDEYEDISNSETFSFNYPGINDSFYRQLTLTYLVANTKSKNNRLIIEFLFHYMHSVGVIKNVTFDNGIEYYSVPNNKNFDARLKVATLLFARIILSDEINHNTRSIRPLYNPKTLEPSWKAPSLLSALYFSIFYMKPGSEIYRKCVNPSCNNYFLVKTSNSRRKYCCGNCRNANNQRSHRIKTQNQN